MTMNDLIFTPWSTVTFNTVPLGSMKAPGLIRMQSIYFPCLRFIFWQPTVANNSLYAYTLKLEALSQRITLLNDRSWREQFMENLRLKLGLEAYIDSVWQNKRKNVGAC
jgi:hypothetical protein